VSSLLPDTKTKDTIVQKKNGKYFADWRDSSGQRHRKAFPTAKEARAFQKAMREARSEVRNR
jgi:hypothetical protein